MPILASFDVGIKNMAVCVFDCNLEVPSILEWTILNMCSSDADSEEKPKCNYITPSKKKSESGKECNKVAKYKTIIFLDNLGEFYLIYLKIISVLNYQYSNV